MSNRRASKDSSLERTPVSKSARRGSLAPGGIPITPPTSLGTERVKVVVRLRPTHPHESAGAVSFGDDNQTLVLQRKHANVSQTDFRFDQVLTAEASQADVYHAVQDIVEAAMQGYNGTLMAYGQTGSGKTYTLSSTDPHNIGMMPRAASAIFSSISSDPANEYTIFMSYIQIYNELIQDLLRPASENLQIREGENGVFVAGVHEQEIKAVEDCLRLLQLGDRNRKVAFTQLNAHSSRSHAIVMLTVIKRRRLSVSRTPESSKIRVGKLFLVDLAGSERLKRSQSTGIRATEAKSINLSLTTLGMCVSARADPQSTHVPFRDSKLTRLLQESLGGNAKTSLIITIADAVESADETLQSLQFGTRAMHVKTQAVLNEALGYKLLNAELIARLDEQDNRKGMVDAALLSKEEDLESLELALKGERDKSSKIIAALQEEREVQEAEQERRMNAVQAELAQERQQGEEHKTELLQTKAQAEQIEEQHRKDKEQLQAALATAQTALQAAEDDRDRVAAAAEQAERKHIAEQERLKQRYEADFAAASSKSAEELEALQESLRQANSERERLETRHEVDMAAASTSQQALDAVRRQMEQAEAERERLKQQFESDMAAAARNSEEQLSGLQQQLRHAEQERDDLRAEIEHLRDEHTESHRIQEEHWEFRLQEAEASAASQIEEQQSKLAAASAALDDLQERTAAAAADQQRELDNIQQEHASLANAHSEALSECRGLRANLQGVEQHLHLTQQQLGQVQEHRDRLERHYARLQPLWVSNKRMNDAARTIQRHFKAWQIRSFKDQTSKDAEALARARQEQSSLAGEKALLEKDQRQHLLWSGQALVASSITCMEDAVHQIRTVFLMPAKELKTLGNLKSRLSMSPSRLSSSPRSSEWSPSLLSRSLSVASNSSNQSFISREAPGFGGGTPGTVTPGEGPLAQAVGRVSFVKAFSPAAKQHESPQLAAAATSIKADWGTPPRH